MYHGCGIYYIVFIIIDYLLTLLQRAAVGSANLIHSFPQTDELSCIENSIALLNIPFLTLCIILPGAVYIPPVTVNLSPIDRKLSAPVLGDKQALPPSYIELEKHLSRCEEVENIPSTVDEAKEEKREW